MCGDALGELARVTRPGGRVLVVEPDNAARYWFSSVPSGMDVFALGQRFFAALAVARGESPAAQTVRSCPACCASTASSRCRCRLFPVSVSHLGSAGRQGLGRAPRGGPAAMIARRPTNRCAGSAPTT